MAGFKTVRSAMRLWAIMVAAGTILGVSANASAQSRLERAERELQRAEQAVNEARREAGQSRRAEQKAQIESQGDCEGCAGCDDPEQIEANVEADDDGEEQIIIRQPQGARRIERRIEVQRADGERCPTCGRPMNDGATRRIEPRGQAMPGAFGELGGFDAFRGQPGQGPHVQVFGGVGGMGGEGARGSRRAIVVGPGGQPHEFTMKLNGPDGPSDGPSDGVAGRAEIRRFHIQTEGGENPFHNQPRQERGAAGMGGAPGVSGKIIIIGPDGQRQEFDLGGNPGEQNPPRRRTPRVQIENFRDGMGPAAHPQEGEQRRTIQVRRISHGEPI